MAPPGGADDCEVARANPVIVNLSTLVAFCIVAIWTLVIAAGVVALLQTAAKSFNPSRNSKMANNASRTASTRITTR